MGLLMRLTFTFALACCATVAFCHPNYIGCDLKVQAGKMTAGKNIITTTDSIMGATPKAGTLASVSTTKYSASSTIAITFSNFGKGIVHTTAGTFSGTKKAADFAGATTGTACTGTQSMLVRNSNGNPSAITWTAPKTAPDMVTLSFASASGFGTVTRQTLTLTKGAAKTPTPAPPTPGPSTPTP